MLENLSDQDLIGIIFCDDEGYEPVTEAVIVDQRRWATCFERVFKRISDGSFWKISWDQGSTEYQNEGPENIEIIQVEPKEVTVIQYVPVQAPTQD